MRIEAVGFGTVADEERLGAKAGLDGFLTLGATREEEQRDQGCCDEPGCFHVLGTAGKGPAFRGTDWVQL